MKYQLGSLSESALSKFVEYLDSSRNGATDEPPYLLLEGDENVSPILFSTGTCMNLFSKIFSLIFETP